jgi:ubiquinone/menaquinone biosynthesis C-methylase UbiE
MKKTYSNEIGYSPLENVDRTKMRQLVRCNKELVDKYFSGNQGDKILVAGAGQGDEAELIFDEFGFETIGVDINIVNLTTLERQLGVSLCKQNLENLAFVDNSFSFIYSYHVLEHVSDHLAVLKELRRVLKPGGVLFIGFPNKHRLFSYIGTSQKASALEKIKWNLTDYSYRIRGMFENRCGAHAGFSEREFLFDVDGIFQEVHPVRNEYMMIKYARFRFLLSFLTFLGLGEVLFPSNYYICL